MANMLLYNLATVNILIVQAFASSCFLKKKKKKASSWGFNQALKVFISLIKAYLHHNQGNFLSLIIWSVLLKWKHVLIPRDINGGTAMALWYSTLPVSTTTPNLVIFDWRKKKKRLAKEKKMPYKVKKG